MKASHLKLISSQSVQLKYPYSEKTQQSLTETGRFAYKSIRLHIEAIHQHK